LRIGKLISQFQQNEITEYYIYRQLASSIKNPHNRQIINKIAEEELAHYNFWKKLTKKEIGANHIKKWLYYFIAKFFGLTFGIKLMEKGEESAQILYKEIVQEIPEAKKIIRQEEEHENRILSLINERFLSYVSSIILGLNDALVELTGALAGYTFAFANPTLIAVAALITGLAASLSMAVSEYLSIKTEDNKNQNPLYAAFYTGTTYLSTVIILVLPYFFIKNIYLDLTISLSLAIIIILIFNYYLSVVRDVSFKKRFVEMAFLSLSISFISFIFGFLIRRFLKIEV